MTATLAAVPLPSVSASPASTANIDSLHPFYAYRDRLREQTRTYVVARPALIPLLLEARSVITRYFGENANATLEVMTYPEGGAPGPLIVWITTTASVSESMAQETQFNEEWWLDHPSPASADLMFNLRYA